MHKTWMISSETNCIQNEEQKKEKELIAEKAAKAGFVNRLYVNIGQKVGVVELTKLEPRFEVLNWIELITKCLCWRQQCMFSSLYIQ